jgi:ABC-type glycerol-3-phosphate transport system substrate-binding protein
MRRLLTLMLLAFAVAVVAGCGGDDDGGESAGAGVPPEEASGTVRVLMEEVPDTDVVESMVSDFEREYPDITMEIEALPYDQMRDRLVSSFLAAEPTYDLIVVDNPWMVDFVEGGFLTPLDERIDAVEGYDFEDFSEPLRAIAEVEGETYGVPFYNYALALVYREDLYDQAGLQPPESLEELKQAADELTDDGRAGIAMQPQRGYKIFEEWGNFLLAAGGQIQDEEGNVTLDTPEAREALEAYIELYEDDAPENSLNWAFDEAIRAVQSDTAAQLINYNWTLPTLNDQGQEAGNFALAEVPGGRAILGAWYWGIPQNSANPDAAWAFVSWLTSKEQETQRVIDGGAPVRNSVMEDRQVWEQGFGEDYYRTVQEILTDAAPLADGPHAEEMIQVVGEELNAAVAGQKSVDEAISEAQRRAEEALAG